jgi:hypothetical protein
MMKSSVLGPALYGISQSDEDKLGRTLFGSAPIKPITALAGLADKEISHEFSKTAFRREAQYQEGRIGGQAQTHHRSPAQVHTHGPRQTSG